jgi:hypothetical protein
MVKIVAVVVEAIASPPPAIALARPLQMVPLAVYRVTPTPQVPSRPVSQVVRRRAGEPGEKNKDVVVVVTAVVEAPSALASIEPSSKAA